MIDKYHISHGLNYLQVNQIEISVIQGYFIPEAMPKAVEFRNSKKHVCLRQRLNWYLLTLECVPFLYYLDFDVIDVIVITSTGYVLALFSQSRRETYEYCL